MLRCEETDDPMADLMGLVDAYLTIAFEYPAYYQLMFEASTRGYSPSDATKQ